jgi:hypothetical protein
VCASRTKLVPGQDESALTGASFDFHEVTPPVGQVELEIPPQPVSLYVPDLGLESPCIPPCNFHSLALDFFVAKGIPGPRPPSLTAATLPSLPLALLPGLGLPERDPSGIDESFVALTSRARQRINGLVNVRWERSFSTARSCRTARS